MLNLVVIRVADLDRSRKFYSVLGLIFSIEQHGAGPQHLAAQAGQAIFEIYPQGSGLASQGVRLGFEVASVRSVVEVAESLGGKVLVSPKLQSGKITAVLQDPDGHKVEINETGSTL